MVVIVGVVMIADICWNSTMVMDVHYDVVYYTERMSHNCDYESDCDSNDHLHLVVSLYSTSIQNDVLW